MTWCKLIENRFLGNERGNLYPIMYVDSKIVRHCNKGCENSMRNNMVAYMRAVEKMDRENGCWKEKRGK